MYNGYTFIGATTATILLGQLASLRIETDETVTEFVLRLQNLFEDLENIPGEAHYVFNDVQRIGYLLQTIRHEPDLAHQHTYIQTAASRNAISFDAACDDLIVRDDALRADLLLNASARPRRALAALPAPVETSTALISTVGKKHVTTESPSTTCLVKGCKQSRNRGLCRRHFVEMTSGKVPSFVLCNGWGTATYSTTEGIILPAAVPKDRRMAGEFKPRSHQA